MQNQPLARWFNEIRTTRTELPVELPLVLSDEAQDSIDSAIALSVAHIERVLDFCYLLDQEEDDEGQADVDLVVRLDAYSYYAALAIPFLRQAVEGSIATCASPRKSFVASDTADSSASARHLAKEMRLIKHSLGSVADSSQFASWCRSLLTCCAHLLLLHMRNLEGRS